jgi:hypothetical protein
MGGVPVENPVWREDSVNEFKSEPASIDALLSQTVYKIPRLQRNYVWTDDEVIALLKDVQESWDDGSEQYFIGGMVFARDGNTRGQMTVIDGQQRMATIMLLFAAARDAATNKHNCPEFAQHMDRKVCAKVWDKAAKQNVHHFWLELQSQDDATFKDLLRGNDVNRRSLSISGLNLYNALQVTREFVDGFTLTELQDYMCYFRDNVYVIKTETSGESSAYRIFETLNAKGSRLEPEDLLKNLLLYKLSDSKAEEFSKQWETFIKNLTQGKSRYIVSPSTFLRHYIMSHGHYIKRDAVYAWFKDESRDQQEGRVLTMLQDLCDSSEKYVNFTQGAGNRAIGWIKRLLFRQGNIPLLAASSLDANDQLFLELCRNLEHLAFAYVITGSKTNQLERSFCEISKEIRNAMEDRDNLGAAVNKVKSLADEKKSLVETALKSFKIRSQGDKRKVHYLLCKLGNALDGGIYDQYTIEHILPETPSSEFKNMNPEEYASLTSWFGNLTLVTGSDNAALCNKPFDEKQKIYAAQTCRLTSSLAREIKTGTTNTIYDRAIAAFSYDTIPSDWQANEIKRRQEALVRLAMHVFFE